VLGRETGETIAMGSLPLHSNELPLRPVFLELDGTTKSPDSFLGPVGKN